MNPTDSMLYLFPRYSCINKAGGTNVLRLPVGCAIVTVIWMYNVACNLPFLVWAGTYPMSPGVIGCSVVNVGRGAFAIYVTVTRCINFYIPLAIIWSAYTGIVIKTRMSTNKVRCHVFTWIPAS
jgi:hypothetical protein